MPLLSIVLICKIKILVSPIFTEKEGVELVSTTPVEPVGDGLITHSDQLYVAEPVKPKEYRLDPITIESTEEYKIDTSKESHREKIGG